MNDITRNLPKIELHCHLDGSVRPETALDIARKEGIALPGEDIDTIRDLMSVADDCPSLDEYLKRFELPGLVMQTESALERIAYELMEDAAAENVKYMEIRFGAQLHRAKGLSLSRVIGSVVRGIKRAEVDFDITGNVILTSLRGFSMESLYEIIEAGREFLGKGVVALDLGAHEAEGFASSYKEPFKLARESGYRITVHAGEAGSGNNVLEAVRLLGAERIGHGVHLKTSPEACDLVKQKGVHLEICPTSNIQTKAVPSYREHPVMDFMREGISVSINTDNRTVSSTDLCHEIDIVSRWNGMTGEEYRQIYLNSVKASFASEEIKARLREYIW